MSHAELCMQEHIILDKRAASIKSRSRSKSQSQPAQAGPAKYLADDTNGNTESQTYSGDSPDSRTRFADEPTQTNDFSIDVIASRRNSLTPKQTASAIADEEALKDIDQLLVKRVLQLAVELETQARVLLMHTMPKGSRPEVLLRADMVRRMPSGAGPLLNFTFIAASES